MNVSLQPNVAEEDLYPPIFDKEALDTISHASKITRHFFSDLLRRMLKPAAEEKQARWVGLVKLEAGHEVTDAEHFRETMPRLLGLAHDPKEEAKQKLKARPEKGALGDLLAVQMLKCMPPELDPTRNPSEERDPSDTFPQKTTKVGFIFPAQIVQLFDESKEWKSANELYLDYGYHSNKSSAAQGPFQTPKE